MAVRLELCNPNPDLSPFELKMGTLVTPILEKVFTKFGFSTLFWL